jgi:repressor LexA
MVQKNLSARSAVKKSGAPKAASRSKREELSDAQAKVYQFIKEKFFSSGSMPTLREICEKMSWKAVGSAQDVISALVQKGWLQKDGQKSRGLQLKQLEDFRTIPLLGAAPAGVPIESHESHDRDLVVPGFIRGPVFAVRVVGESMVEAGIHDRDIAIVRQAPMADDGEIVVAMVDGEVTIKRLRKRRGELWLYPENSRFSPKRIEPEASFRVLGKVIGLHRYWE